MGMGLDLQAAAIKQHRGEAIALWTSGESLGGIAKKTGLWNSDVVDIINEHLKPTPGQPNPLKGLPTRTL